MTVHKRLQNTEDQPISPRKHSGHKMPPLGYKDRSKVLESTKNVPTSVGINAINRPQSANVENPAPEDMSDETSIASDNDEEESSEVDEQSPSSDTWLKNWVSRYVPNIGLHHSNFGQVSLTPISLYLQEIR
jgi:hypothetical protein